jgi:hypothetical protein
MLIYIIFLFVMLLILWFNTEVFVEYSKALKLNWFKTQEYLIAKETDFTLTYHSFLIQKYNGFFVKLITCPYCINFWMILLGKLILGYLFIEIPTIYVTSLIIYFIFNKLSP